MNEMYNGDRARRALWSYTLDEIIEIISLIDWAEEKYISTEKESALHEYVKSACGDRPISRAIRYHMQQLLSVKIESIFGKRGESCVTNLKEVTANADLGNTWWDPMRRFADSSIDNPDDTRHVINRLRRDRNTIVAHREGKIADFAHESEALMIFRADPKPLTSAELIPLARYFRACKYFCNQAEDKGSGPILPASDKLIWAYTPL